MRPYFCKSQPPWKIGNKHFVVAHWLVNSATPKSSSLFGYWRKIVLVQVLWHGGALWPASKVSEPGATTVTKYATLYIHVYQLLVRLLKRSQCPLTDTYCQIPMSAFIFFTGSPLIKVSVAITGIWGWTSSYLRSGDTRSLNSINLGPLEGIGTISYIYRTSLVQDFALLPSKPWKRILHFNDGFMDCVPTGWKDMQHPLNWENRQ